jgi:shikimate kinase
MKPCLIILRGSLGIGKTTVSKKLAEKLKAKVFHIDRVLEENGLDKKDNNFTAEDFIKANKIILPDVKNILEKGKIVILDGCFYFKEQIEHLERKFKNYVFTLKAPLETCIKRDKGRKKVYGEQAAREVYKLVSKFDYGQIINTEGKSVKETVEEIFNLLH